MNKIILVGFGNVGKKILQEYKKEIVYISDSQRKISDFTGNANLIIDFSNKSSINDIYEYIKKNPQVKLICGTTGYDDGEKETLQSLGEITTVIYSENFSKGVYALYKANNLVNKILNHDYDISLIERHRKTKKDSPSGTSKMLINKMINKPKDVISLREGNINGCHEIEYYGKSDILSLKHELFTIDSILDGVKNSILFIDKIDKGFYNYFSLLDNVYDN